MKTSKYMERIQTLLDIAKPVAGGRYVIYAQGQKLNLCLIKARPGISALVTELTAYDINTGPTKGKWEQIHMVLVRLMEEGIL